MPDTMPDTVPGPRAPCMHGFSARGAPLITSISRSPRDAVLALPAQEAWVGSARRFASTLLARWCLSADERDTAVLIVSELTANAARHGRSDMTVRLTLHPDALHIAVADHGDPAPPTPSPADIDPAEHGRGLHIVHALATRLDIRLDGGGRQVTASLRIATGPPQAAAEYTGTARADASSVQVKQHVGTHAGHRRGGRAGERPERSSCSDR